MTEQGRQRILVVDDDEHILNSLSQYLEMEGYEVQTARSGQDALDRVGQWTPDLVVMDLMMPEMNGFEVVESLRSGGATAHVPIIVLSARSQDTDVVKGYEMGVSSYLTKPFNLDDLMENIREVFEEEAE